MRFSLVFAVFLFFINGAFAQSYGTALGVRVTDGNIYRTVGLTLNQRILPKFTIEGIVQTDFTENTTFHAIMQLHQPIITKRLNYYLGAGLMGGKEQDLVKDKTTGIQTTTYDNKVFGADLIAGIEFTALKFNISFDYKPNFNIVGRESWYQGQFGISARAVLISGAKMDKRRRDKEREKRKEVRKSNWENSNLKRFFDKDIFN